MIATMKLKEDCLTSMLTDFLQKKKFDEAYGFVDNTNTRKFCRERPQTKLFCRYWGDFFLSSAAYGRGCLADRYVAVWAEDEFVTGEILFFFESTSRSCILRKLKIVKKLKLVKTEAQRVVPFGFIVEDTEEKIEVPLTAIKYKMFYFQYQESYLITMLRHFEHN